MTKYNTLNVKLSNLQLNKSKSAIKYGTELTLIFFNQIWSEIILIKLIIIIHIIYY